MQGTITAQYKSAISACQSCAIICNACSDNMINPMTIGGSWPAASDSVGNAPTSAPYVPVG